MAAPPPQLAATTLQSFQRPPPSAQAVQNNGSVFVHAVFDATVRAPPPPAALDEDDAELVPADGRERRVQFTRTWREFLSLWRQLRGTL